MTISASNIRCAPRISVIVPIYNVAAHVAACIQSVRAQTLTEFEVLLVDDGSTDGSGDIALAAAQGDPRFRLIRQENAGLAAARNTGLDHATGSYIAFVDSDDRVMPDYLMRMWQVLEDSGADWVACAIQFNAADGSGGRHSAIHGHADLGQHTALRRYPLDNWCDVIVHFPSAWNKLYRRSLIEGLRFDTGIWFEDHGFFYRAAARADHILHLPEALYLQTRGRTGQITTQDDERVFDQFAVLETLGRQFDTATRPGGQTAFARIASRLIFERSTVIADADRRARFADAARIFLQKHGLTYSPDWDAGIGRSWAIEMAGSLPLSVVLSWDGKDRAALDRSLVALRDQTAPGFEALIVCQSKAARRRLVARYPDMPSHWQTICAPHKGEGAGFNHGLAQARGTYVMFVQTGDALTPWTLLQRTEAMLHTEAAFGITQMQLAHRDTDQTSYHNGMLDMGPWPLGAPPAGLSMLTPAQAISLEAHCSAKIFLRAFLGLHRLGFTSGPRPDWALCLNVALLAARATYIPHAGALIAMRDDGFERWHIPWGALALARGHSALVQAVGRVMSQGNAPRLPEGWQRRLFARALREQVYFGDYTGRLSRWQMLAGAACTALWHGYGANRDAGLDPFVGPRLARMLDPIGVVLGRMGRIGRIAINRRASATLPAKESRPLHAFDLKDHGLLILRAKFHLSSYANIYFQAAGRDQVLFHLSLRQNEGLAVCNSQGPDGQWKAEIRRAVTLPSTSAEVTLEFGPHCVRVLLDGAEIFNLGTQGQHKDARFAELGMIEGFHTNGGFMPIHLLPQMPQAALVFDSRLTLRLRSPSPTALRHSLTCDANQPPAELGLITAPQGTATTLVPASLWRDLSADKGLTLELVQGARTDRLTLTRSCLAARIEALLLLPLAPSDSTLCLTLIEHVRYANLRPLLSVPALTHLDRLAAQYDVQSFVKDDDAGPISQPPTPLTPPPSLHDPIDQEVASVVARLAQSQSVAPAQRPDPLAVLALMQVSPAAQAPLFLELAEHFCTQGRDFEGLFQLAKARGLLPLPHAGSRWAVSANLPYLVADKRYHQAAKDLTTLKEPTTDWLVTPAIAWAVRICISQPQTPARSRSYMFDAFCAFLWARVDNYWDRLHCHELTRTAAALILQRHRLMPDQQQNAVAICVQIYGLSRQFWAELAGASDLPFDLLQAQAAFAVIASDHADAAQKDKALRLFETEKAVDAPRMRRELFGPAGLPAASEGAIAPADLGALLTPNSNTLGRNILRHMAFPGSAPVQPQVAEMARTALPDLYPQTPRAPYLETQQHATQQALALLKDPSQDSLAAALTDSLGQISDADSHHLGLGIAVSIIDALHDTSPDRAEVFCDWVRTTVTMLDSISTADSAQIGAAPPESWRSAPALYQPLRRLTDRADLLPAAQALVDDLAIPLAMFPVADNGGLPDGHPLFDTIVTVFSCVPYLDSRIPAMRAGWLGRLVDLGVPYVVVVGGGDGTRTNDIVHLDAPDDYEGLPQKTLAAIKWVHNNTRYGHMLKIDDDCFLNAPLFFQSLSYRKFDYYGRYLYRAVGQMDRKWHQGKSSSQRGRLDLDKSPEPSEYADGGTGYALSRTAMAAALEAADSAEGQQLIATSFMEDKMLGDLLAMRDIRPNEQDYRISMRRRTYGAAIPVALWHNSFHPSQTAPLQLVHLDTHLDQADALARLDKPGLWPRKIWPSYQDVKLGYQSNALELISTEQSVENARNAAVAVVACMRNEMFMLPHFLNHYRKLGAEAFLIADNCSDDGTLEYLAQQPDVTLFSVDTDYKLSHYGVAWQQAMMSAFRVGKWSLVADADELLVWQERQSQTLPELLRQPAFADVDAARIFMLDMYPQGPLEEADFATGSPFDQAGFADSVPFLSNTLTHGPYSNQPCWTSALRHRLIKGSHRSLFVAQKLALLRYQPWMRLSAGLHFVGDVRIAQRELLFAHFKYNADFRRKAQAEVMRGQHFNDAEEYRKYLALVSEGRSVIFDPDHSQHWSTVDFVKRRL
ncbi:glycosyltransferase [Pseudorhodobacter wandonensis]|uniref:glycosyltransferase n=1 Tax=Pseudorhodobacter wandonensis TaxID=1120568 RepID=UPI00067C2991|nr:glycosyltransferase [Pseudorhodobacter wandonensis]